MGCINITLRQKLKECQCLNEAYNLQFKQNSKKCLMNWCVCVCVCATCQSNIFHCVTNCVIVRSVVRNKGCNEICLPQCNALLSSQSVHLNKTIIYYFGLCYYFQILKCRLDWVASQLICKDGTGLVIAVICSC